MQLEEQLKVANMQLESRRGFIQLLRAQLALAGSQPLPPGASAEDAVAAGRGSAGGAHPFTQLQERQVVEQGWLHDSSTPQRACAFPTTMMGTPPRASLPTFFRSASARGPRRPQSMGQRSTAVEHAEDISVREPMPPPARRAAGASPHGGQQTFHGCP